MQVKTFLTLLKNRLQYSLFNPLITMDDITQMHQEQDAQGTSADTQETEQQRLEREGKEYLEGWRRAKADLINYKKEEVQRFEAILKMANEQIIKDLLVVLDSFDLALAALKSDPHTEKGVYMIQAQLEDVLAKHGVTRVQTQKGEEFNPMLHEALAMLDADQPSGTVVDEVERGYMLNGKLIRPARVRVAK